MTRYEPNADSEMVECSGGDYVLYDDYQREMAECVDDIQELREELKAIKSRIADLYRDF